VSFSAAFETCASGKTSIIIFVLAICIAFSAVVLGEFLQQLLKHELIIFAAQSSG
jgi:putative Mn2+ efflux pump MntP